MKALYVCAAVTAAAFLVSGCNTGPGASGDAADRPAAESTAKPDPNATLRVAVSGNPTGFDPHQIKSALSDPGFLAPVYDNLITLDADGALKPMLAESWEMAPDNKVLTLHLRAGVKFQDGTAFDAAAVKANLERAKNLPTSTGARFLTTVTAVNVASPDTVQVVFREPNPSFPFTLATNTNISAMISPAAMNKPDLARNPVGTGGMRLVRMGQDRAEYEKVPGYWDADAYNFARLELISILDDNPRLSALQTGQVDATFVRPQQYASYRDLIRTGKMQLFEPDVAQLYGLYLNVGTPETRDPRVRKAISMAIDRTAIAEGFFFGQADPAYQVLPASMPGHVAALDKDVRDVAAAKKLLAEAGQPQLTISVISPGIEPATSILQALQDQLDAVGVKLEIDTFAGSAARATWREGAHGAYLSAVTTGLDPSVFIRETVLGPDNPGGVSDDVRSAAEEALSIGLDDPARPRVLETLTERFTAAPNAIPIVRVPIQYLASPKVQNLDGMQPGLLLGSAFDARYVTVASA